MKRCVDIDEFKESLVHCKELGRRGLELVLKVLSEQSIIEVDERLEKINRSFNLIDKKDLIKNLHEAIDGSSYDSDYKEMGIDDYILNQPEGCVSDFSEKMRNICKQCTSKNCSTCKLTLLG